MRGPVFDPKIGKYGQWINERKLPTSDEMLHSALKYPPGSKERRSFIEAALMLEPRPRGRPKGTAKPRSDNFAFLLMYRIAVGTGERGAERLARLAVATGLLHEKATPSSTVHRLAKCWRQRASSMVRKELDELTAKVAKKGVLEDHDTAVRQLRNDPYWRERSDRRKPEK